jgi:benzoyl-CoA reductase/2-hydroxyglutaryl-CoA dehydratase subunit BcrC/BadD/HgdB
MADPAAYADGQVKLRLDAFLELLKMKKGLL